MATSVEMNLNLDLITAKMQNNIGVGVRRILEDIHREANDITPYKDNGLRSSVTKQMLDNNHGYISWNVPYAAAQEQGGRTDPRTGKYIEFQNYTTLGTGKEYAKTALDRVMKKPLATYFGDILR